MKTRTQIITTTLAATLVLGMAGLVAAQPGTGPGMGGGPGMQGTGPGAQQAGPATGWRSWRFDQGNTRGWTLMTPDERAAHQTRMAAVKTYQECKQVQDEQRQSMEARAKEKGVTLAAPRQNGCDVAKARGWLK